MSEWTKERHAKVLAMVKTQQARGVGGFDPDLPDALAEIERGWAEIERLTAPVDVEAEVREIAAREEEHVADAEEATAYDVVKDIVRPLVEDRARLAREVERLNGQLIDMNGERLTFERSAHRCANEAREARAEVARLTAVKSAEIAPIIERFQAAFGADTPKAPSFTAAQGEAWERLRVVAKNLAAGSQPMTGARHRSMVETEQIEALCAALAAVEPVVGVEAITHDFRPGAQDGLPRLADVEAAPVHPDLARRLAGSIATRRAVPAMTAERAREVAAIEARHALAADPDVGIDAQDAHEDRGTLLAWVRDATPPRALTEAEAASLATHAEILGGDSRPTIATHEIRREGDSAIVAEQWTDGDEVVKRYEVRLDFSGLVHMALNTTAEERAAIDERADWRGVDDANTHASPLTEAEARTWAAIVLRPGGVRVIDVAAALLAASRGDVPPEVRPTKCSACDGHEVVRYDGYDSEGWAKEGPCPVCCAVAAKPEMAVTTGEDAPWTPKPGDRVRTADELTAVGYGPGYCRLPGIAGALTEEHSEGGWWVRHDDGPEAPYDTDELRPAPAGVPSIAGPAGLDAAQKAGGAR